MQSESGPTWRKHPLPPIELGIKLFEEPSASLIKAGLAEFICTMLFIFLSTGSVCFGCHLAESATTSATNGVLTEPVDCLLSNTRVLSIATVFGISLFAMVYASAAFSGGHLNPAVTLAFVLSKKISLVRAVVYWHAQLIGAILGSAFVRAIDVTGFLAAKGGVNRLLTGISGASGWLMETILTFSLVFVVFCATDQTRAVSTAHLPILAPIAIGFVVFADHLVAVPIDGCSVNPARSFGPAVVSGNWEDQWLFWVGPFSGAVVACLVYELLLRPSRHPKMPPLEGGEEVRMPPSMQQTAKLPGFAGVSGLDNATSTEEQLAHPQDQGAPISSNV